MLNTIGNVEVDVIIITASEMRKLRLEEVPEVTERQSRDTLLHLLNRSTSLVL